MTRRRALTLLEVLLAVAILSIGATSIFWTLREAAQQTVRADVSLVGRLLAQSILEQAVERHRTADARYFDITATPTAIVEGAASGRWKMPFMRLAQPRVALLAAKEIPNQYFGHRSSPIVPAPMDPDERRQFERFSYEVSVLFDVSPRGDSTKAPLDADGDGRGETDLARLEVQVFFRPPENEALELPVCRLTTLISRPDKIAGAGALGEF